MKKLLLLCLLYAAPGKSQENKNRSLVSIMTVLSPGTNDKEGWYNHAISRINSALIDMGYKRTLDAKKYFENFASKDSLAGNTRTNSIDYYIGRAPVDVIIETEITWIDPPGNPRDRQVTLRLKAVDNYTSAVYADISSIQSSQREFPDPGAAVQTALARDGKAEFKTFLDQLDSSYADLLRGGRQVNVQFGIDRESTAKFTDIIRDERFSDHIIEFTRKKAIGGQFSVIGESPTYMQFNVFVPIVDSTGMHTTPSTYLRKDIDAYCRKLGFDVTYAVRGSWIYFTMLNQKRQ